MLGGGLPKNTTKVEPPCTNFNDSTVVMSITPNESFPGCSIRHILFVNTTKEKSAHVLLIVSILMTSQSLS